MAKRIRRKFVWTDEMLDVLRSASYAKHSAGSVMTKLQELDPTITYQAVRHRYKQMMAAGLVPAWIQIDKRKKQS